MDNGLQDKLHQIAAQNTLAMTQGSDLRHEKKPGKAMTPVLN